MSRRDKGPGDPEAMRRAIAAFLEASGLAVEGELEHTPENVARAWQESFLDGYSRDPAVILESSYAHSEAPGSTAMVLLKDIAFHGMCPHHLLPFHGQAHVAYIPGKKLASLSSLGHLVDCFAHRLEIQEVVTRQIAEALVTHLEVTGAAVAVETDQTCLTTRGIEKKGARTITRHFAGKFAAESALRAEFLQSVSGL